MYNPKQMMAGLISGLFAPAVVIYFFYLSKFPNSTFSSFVEAAIQQNIASPIIALSIIINAGLFFLFLKFDRLWASRGILLSTLLYGLIMLYLKLGA